MSESIQGQTSEAIRAIQGILTSLGEDSKNCLIVFQELSNRQNKILGYLDEHTMTLNATNIKKNMEGLLTRITSHIVAAAVFFFKCGGVKNNPVSSFSKNTIQKQNQFDVFHSDFDSFRDVCEIVIGNVRGWIDSVRQQCIQWQQIYSGWIGDVYNNDEAQRFINRIEDVLNIRITLQQIQQLLKEKKESTNTGVGQQKQVIDNVFEKIFDPFIDIDILNTQQLNDKQWEEAMQQFNKRLEPTELLVAQKLQNILMWRQSKKVQQTIREMKRYQLLLKRPKVSQSLKTERESIIKEMRDEVLEIQQLLSSVKSIGFEKGGNQGINIEDEFLQENVPSAVRIVMYVQQLQNKALFILDVTNSMFIDISQGVQLANELQIIITQSSEKIQLIIKEWNDNLFQQFNTTGDPSQFERLLIIDQQTGLINVQNDNWQTEILRGSRYFASQGINLSPEIKRLTISAAVGYKHGVQLKQLTAFYNSIIQQIIPSQKLLLQDQIDAFESLVNNSMFSGGEVGAQSGQVRRKKDGELKSQQEIELYIQKLRSSAESIHERNILMRCLHAQILERVRRLLRFSLNKEYGAWKIEIKESFNIIDQLQQRGMNVSEWRLHWSYQIYKVFRVQFVQGLTKLLSEINDKHVELVFEGRQCQLRPGLQELRLTLFQEVKRYIQTKFKIGALVGLDDLFDQITEGCAKQVASIFMSIERIIFHVELIRKQYAAYAVLSDDADVTEVFESACKTPQDWERALIDSQKQTSQKKDLPSDIRVECVIISLLPLKQAVEEQSTTLTQNILFALKSSIRKDAGSILEMAQAGAFKLQEEVQSMNEIIQAKETATSIYQNVLKHETILKNLQRKVQILEDYIQNNESIQQNSNSWINESIGIGVNGPVEQLANAQQAFESTKAVLDGRMKNLNMKRKVLKNNTDIQRIQMQQKAAGYAREWKQNQIALNLMDPKSIQTNKEIFKKFIERASEIEKEFDSLQVECQIAQLDPPIGRQEIKVPLSEIEDINAIIKVFDEYTNELDSMMDTEWVIFRGKMSQFDDFVTKWNDLMPNYQPQQQQPKQQQQSIQTKDNNTNINIRCQEAKQSLYQYLQQQSKKFQDTSPLLRLVRGDEFTDEHWKELFRMIGIPKETTAASLKFKQLINAIPQLKLKVQQIKILQRKAQGEVDIRRGMDDIKVWGTQTSLHIIEHQCASITGPDNKARITPIVEDWSEMLSQLDDKSAQLSAMRDSPFFPPFKETADQWESHFVILGTAGRLLMNVQRRWIYLEPVFLRGAIPSQQSRFMGVDRQFRDIMQQLKQDSTLPTLFNINGIESISEEMQKELQHCQQALSEFLEEKRDKFPRFYFIGDDDLLEILGQAQTPSVIQAHLKKLFQAGEVVNLSCPVTVTDAVED
ncbi:MAG: putative dynein heavy chain, partial [Streblomastix strix]